MDAQVRRELNDLLMIIDHWRDDYIRIAGGAEGYGFLVADLAQEIEEYVYPYVRRMRECQYITDEELGAFLNQCYERVTSLAGQLP